MNRRLLITGAGGQLAGTLRTHLASRWEVHAPEESELDIADVEKIQRAVESAQPAWIINCAAWTQVDLAESRVEAAYSINDASVGRIADAALQANARVLHFSTDFVFDGTARRPYVEEDTPNPLGAYGASKLAGEERLLRHRVRAAILRTSWLYSETGNNFYRTMLRLAAQCLEKGQDLRVVSDQRGTPTDTHSLAIQVEEVLERDLEGLYHASCQGEASWYDFARAIFERHEISVEVTPIPTADYPTPARRPAYSVLENRALQRMGADRMRAWRDGLDDVVRRDRAGSDRVPRS